MLRYTISETGSFIYKLIVIINVPTNHACDTVKEYNIIN